MSTTGQIGMPVLADEYVGPLEQAFLATVDIQRSYNRYFETGLYSTRYPAPNPHVLKLVLGELGPKGGRVLDFGCGSGRYALPLVQQPGVSVFAYDISPTAIQQLRQRYAALTPGAARLPRLETLCGSLDDLGRRLEGDGGFDLVVLLFGVLGHVEHRARRVATLRALRARLRPGGRLIATVPNRARRFLAEQKAMRVLGQQAEPGDVRYRRGGSQDPIELYYHLYTPAEFCAELGEAGYVVSSLRPESVLTERMVLSSRVGNTADRLLRQVTPLALAYGLVAIAEPDDSA